MTHIKAHWERKENSLSAFKVLRLQYENRTASFPDKRKLCAEVLMDYSNTVLGRDVEFESFLYVLKSSIILFTFDS